MTGTCWRLSWRADPVGASVADRHYNRQTPGAAQFVPPGRCIVLVTEDEQSVWTTSWPFEGTVPELDDWIFCGHAADQAGGGQVVAVYRADDHAPGWRDVAYLAPQEEPK